MDLPKNEGYFDPAKLDASSEEIKTAPDLYRHRHAFPSITAILATDEVGILQLEDATPTNCCPDYTFSLITTLSTGMNALMAGLGKYLPSAYSHFTAQCCFRLT